MRIIARLFREARKFFQQLSRYFENVKVKQEEAQEKEILIPFEQTLESQKQRRRRERLQVEKRIVVRNPEKQVSLKSQSFSCKEKQVAFEITEENLSAQKSKPRQQTRGSSPPIAEKDKLNSKCDNESSPANATRRCASRFKIQVHNARYAL